MSTIRCLLSYNRVVCSRPGYDATSPPAYTSDYLALDSNWNFSHLERPIQAGLLFNLAVSSGASISYGRTITPAPMVQILQFVLGTPIIISHEPQIHVTDGSGHDQWTSPFTINPHTNGFSFRSMPGGGFANSWVTTPRNWMYIVWAA